MRGWGLEKTTGGSHLFRRFEPIIIDERRIDGVFPERPRTGRETR
jgi:hypothetical protein